MKPVLFSEIIGQDLAKRVLAKAIAGQRIPHAYLFSGIPGIGKTSMARALALALNCENPTGVEGCGKCSACRRIKSGNSPDFNLLVQEGQNIRINQVRELSRSLSFAPAVGKYRISVLKKAESMTVEAANAFLKTLEEPPVRNVFVLTVGESLDLLPTILSRCQKIPFHPLPIEEVVRTLEDQKGLDQEKASVLGRASGGSLGWALKMAEGSYMDRRQEWLFNLVKLPSLSPREVLALALECAAGDVKASLETPGGGEPGLLEMLGIWESWYRDLVVRGVKGAPRLITNEDFSRKLKSAGASFTIEALIDSIFCIDLAQRDLRRNRNPGLVMEHMLLNLKRLCS